MMTYALQGLLSVRNFREESAASQMASSRVALEEAEALVETREKEKAAWHQERLRQEDLLFKEIHKKLVQLKDLDDVKQRVLILRDRELALVKKVHDARAAVKTAQKKLEEDTRRWRMAVRDKEKIVAHRQDWEQESAREQERLAELEMEDFRVRPNQLTAEVSG